MWAPSSDSSMNHNPDIRHRRSNRLKGYHYSRPGAYFLTIATQDRLCLFGDIIDGDMRLKDAGEMALAVWERLPGRFPGIETDAFVVMPNHIHGILVIDEPVGASPVDAPNGGRPTGTRATTRVAPTLGPSTLGNVVGAYKSLTTVAYIRGIRTLAWAPFKRRLWQRNYYEHIVRDDESLDRIRQYILDNPAQWAFDRENPMAESRQDTTP